MRPAAIRLVYNALVYIASFYVGIVLYAFATVEIDTHHELIDGLEHKGAEFYNRFRLSAAAALHQTQGDVGGDDLPKEPECPLPPAKDSPILSAVPPEPYLLRTGEPKYLPAPKPADESCLRWKSSNGCWEHYSSSAKLCRFDNMALNADAFHVSKGGELPEDVKGREEYEESFTVDNCGVHLPFKPSFWTQWYQSKLLGAAGEGVPDRNQCDVYLPGLTLMFERIEYANLYHTFTDWFNVHWSLEKLKYGRNGPQELRIIWLDGHAKSNLDEVWADIFHANITYISQHKGIVCMERGVWLPKNSPVYDIPKSFVDFSYDEYGENSGGGSNCGVMDRFIERVLTAYDIPQDRVMDESLDLVIDRQAYFAHPRVDMEKATNDARTLPDMQAMFPSSRVIKLHEMSFKEQVELISRAKSLRGVHGAGLTHLLWLPKGASVVEFQPEDYFENQLFGNLATWVPGISHQTGPMPQKPKGMLESFVEFLFGTGKKKSLSSDPYDSREIYQKYGRDMIDINAGWPADDDNAKRYDAIMENT